MPIPNTTFRSTAMPATRPVSTIACTVVGSTIVSQNVPNPCWIVRHRTTPSGTSTSTPTYPTAIPARRRCSFSDSGAVGRGGLPRSIDAPRVGCGRRSNLANSCWAAQRWTMSSRPITTRLMARRAVAVAAAAASSSFSIWLYTYIDEISVLNCSPPEMRTTEPYSPIARAKANAAPPAIAGKIAGRMIRRNVVNRLAPRAGGRLLDLTVELQVSTGCTVRTTNGSVTNSRARDDASGRRVPVDPHRAVRAVQA